MTTNEFLQSFYLRVEIENQENLPLSITTEMISRVDENVVSNVNTKYDIQDISQNIRDSQTAISLNPLGWDDIIEFTKQSHIGFFALSVPIEDFSMLESQENFDLSRFFE